MPAGDYYVTDAMKQFRAIYAEARQTGADRGLAVRFAEDAVAAAKVANADDRIFGWVVNEAAKPFVSAETGEYGHVYTVGGPVGGVRKATQEEVAKPPIMEFSHGPNGRYRAKFLRRANEWYGVACWLYEVREAGEVIGHCQPAVTDDVTAVYRQVDKVVERTLRTKELEENQARAYARATELLTSHLSPAQLQSYEAEGSFIVEDPNGQLWSVGGQGMGVYQHMDTGHRHCAYSVDCPAPDTTLMHKMMIESGNGQSLLGVSCRH